MAAEREHGWYRTEGGTVLKMDHPLHESIADRVTKGMITRVANEAGDPYVPASGDDPSVPHRPAKSAAKAEWVGWAVRAHGVAPDDAEAMTKQDLVEKYDRDPAPVV